MLRMRLPLFLLLAFALTTFQVLAEEDKGTMEKAGAYIDKTVEGAKEFLSDTTLTARVKKRLYDDEKTDSGQLKITTDHGTVLVEGEVRSEDMARRVIAIVKATEGVMKTENRLVILTGTPSQIK